MILKIIPLLIFTSFIFFVYKKRLQSIMHPMAASIGALALAVVSLNPIGLLIGSIGLIALPRATAQAKSMASSICAKCGTLSKKGETICHHCQNILQ